MTNASPAAEKLVCLGLIALLTAQARGDDPQCQCQPGETVEEGVITIAYGDLAQGGNDEQIRGNDIFVDAVVGENVQFSLTGQVSNPSGVNQECYVDKELEWTICVVNGGESIVNEVAEVTTTDGNKITFNGQFNSCGRTAIELRFLARYPGDEDGPCKEGWCASQTVVLHFEVSAGAWQVGQATTLTLDATAKEVINVIADIFGAGGVDWAVTEVKSKCRPCCESEGGGQECRKEGVVSVDLSSSLVPVDTVSLLSRTFTQAIDQFGDVTGVLEVDAAVGIYIKVGETNEGGPPTVKLKAGEITTTCDGSEGCQYLSAVFNVPVAIVARLALEAGLGADLGELFTWIDSTGNVLDWETAAEITGVAGEVSVNAGYNRDGCGDGPEGEVTIHLDEAICFAIVIEGVFNGEICGFNLDRSVTVIDFE